MMGLIIPKASEGNRWIEFGRLMGSSIAKESTRNLGKNRGWNSKNGIEGRNKQECASDGGGSWNPMRREAKYSLWPDGLQLKLFYFFCGNCRRSFEETSKENKIAIASKRDDRFSQSDRGGLFGGVKIGRDEFNLEGLCSDDEDQRRTMLEVQE
ncbi:unnamed protein product [Ilex paraguariensis]|uniref:Uncharacterized protein n=1 Tax=Ilex paraguariensis TaxID=185542 RepID=A0ABC8QZW3_9AQUA